MHNSILHRLYIVVRVHHPSQVSSHQLYPLYPLLPPSTPFPSGNRHTVCVYEGLCVGGGEGGDAGGVALSIHQEKVIFRNFRSVIYKTKQHTCGACTVYPAQGGNVRGT